jgi:hypothetical protein
MIAAAESLIAAAFAAFDAALYQEYFRNGNRSRFQNQNRPRWETFQTLVKAECLEGKGRFVPALTKAIESLCADPSWCLPAHDHGAWIFKGNKPFVDLGVAMNGGDMATAVWLLEKSLPAATVALARENIQRRLTTPVLEHLSGIDPEFYNARHWWARNDNNWNAVCTAGAVCAILMTSESPDVRASAVNWATRNMATFLGGFAADGYCTEGIGYWDYGFRHFAVLSSLVAQQTNGKVNWMAGPRPKQIVAAALGQELGAKTFPAFADAPLNAKPGEAFVGYLARLGICQPTRDAEPIELFAGGRSLLESVTFVFSKPSPQSAGTAGAATLERRTWLPAGGVYVGRGASTGDFAVAWKGGHNDEHHNHNDVGSTVVYHAGQVLLCDPGAMEYTSETFSKNRYLIPVMSSFGHSVPVVGNSYQLQGSAARGVVGLTRFTDQADSIRMDLTSCYPLDGLQAIERTWTFERGGSGALTLEDRLRATRPLAFESALMTTGTWQQVAPDLLVATGVNNAALAVQLSASGPLIFHALRLVNPGRPDTTRLGIQLTVPTTAGFIRARIAPATPEMLAKARPLKVAEAPARLAAR